MPIVYDKLLALKIPEIDHTYGPKDCILYALGLGFGHDPTDEDELAFVYEKNLKALPTFALVQGYTPYWLRNPETGVDWTKVVHGEQSFVLHKPVATQGVVIGRTRIVDVIDKGAGKGALVYSERLVVDKASGEILATLRQTTFCRADGGFGGPKGEAPQPHPLPARAPDVVCDLPTRPEMALIYRLSAPSRHISGVDLFLYDSDQGSRNATRINSVRSGILLSGIVALVTFFVTPYVGRIIPIPTMMIALLIGIVPNSGMVGTAAL